MLIRELKNNENGLLKDFLYEAIFVPEGMDPPAKEIVEKPELKLYYEDFGKGEADYCFVAEDNDKVVGAVWTRIMNYYGHVDEKTPSFAISLSKEYRGKGIGTSLMKRMLELLKEKGFQKASLAVQKKNAAVRMYRRLGFHIVDENEEEYIMVCMLEDTKKPDTPVLRDMLESDIEDYVRWFTADTEWSDWDAPWEPLEGDEEKERRRWTEYYESVKDLPDDAIRRKYEIEADGQHIGWINCYTDLGYLENQENIPAIGLDIPCAEYRNHGCGTKAFQIYIDYLKEHGHRSFYTQTWSGNRTMMRVAEKLGFKEIHRIKDDIEIDHKKYDAVTYRLDL